jgi:glycosyltransferase involved in cell wall biosynthesis
MILAARKPMKDNIAQLYSNLDILQELVGSEGDLELITDNLFMSFASTYVKAWGLTGDQPLLQESPYSGYNSTFTREILKSAKSIPDSNGSRFYNKLPFTIGIVCDDWLYNSYESAADFVYLTYQNYLEHLDTVRLLFVYTTWHGLSEEWTGLNDPQGQTARDLLSIISKYKEQGVKTVFFSGEDPPHYDQFLYLAQKCDFVFTSAAEKIDDYKRACGHDDVYQLPFAINPLLHNPIGSMSDAARPGVLFAGSWFSYFPERCEDMQMILDGVIESGVELNIIDRFFEQSDATYIFPEKYIPYISPSVDHKTLQKIHRLFTYALNFNSVKYSPTMFANRVTELQAMGNILLSNYSIGINNLFPNVKLYVDKVDIGFDLTKMSSKDILELRMAGVRQVMSGYSSFDVIAKLLAKVGLGAADDQQKVILVVADAVTSQVNEMFNAQSYPHKQLVSYDEFLGMDITPFTAIAFWNNSYRYEQYYLEDLLNGFKYTDSDYITKDAHYECEQLVDGISHDYVSCMPDKYRSLFWARSFSLEQLQRLEGPVELNNGYSIDPVGLDTAPNTVDKVKEASYELTVIIPVYNNGRHLEFKAFSSLKRSSIFEKSIILLIDDGSADQETIEIMKRLARSHVNVETYYFPIGGSGSASRPRNKGIELTTTPYVTFLDPDDEAIDDGYQYLLEDIKRNQCDLSLGYMEILDDKQTSHNLSPLYRKALSSSNLEVFNPRDFLVKIRFAAQSIQAMVLNTEHIKNHSLRMVEGALGEDTFFFYQLMNCSEKIRCFDIPIRLYYAAVTSSESNNRTSLFFKKSMVCEKLVYDWLLSVSLMEEYIEYRLPAYFATWFLQKLQLIGNEEEFIKSAYILHEYLSMYNRSGYQLYPELRQILTLFELGDWDSIRKLDYEAIAKDYPYF